MPLRFMDSGSLVYIPDELTAMTTFSIVMTLPTSMVPNRNCVVYDKEALKKTLGHTHAGIPVRSGTKTIGVTTCSPYAIQDTEDGCGVRFTVNGKLFFADISAIMGGALNHKKETTIDITCLNLTE